MAPVFKRSLLETVAAGMLDVMGLDPNPFERMDQMKDDVLLETLRYEATGRGVANDAIRADDFVSADAKKKTFAPAVAQFFADAGVWDTKACQVIMLFADDEQPAAGGEEQAAHDEMEAGENEDSPPPAAVPEKAKKSAKAKSAAATPAPPQTAVKAGKTKPAAVAPPVEKEQEGVMAKTNAVSKKTATAKKRAAKSVAATKKTAVKAGKAKAAPANLDAFGFREGSNTSKAVAFLAGGKHTMAEAKEKFGGTFYSALKKVKESGGKVVANDDSTFTITAKK
jgi:type IV secretory pathway VirB10-like protein